MNYVWSVIWLVLAVIYSVSDAQINIGVAMAIICSQIWATK